MANRSCIARLRTDSARSTIIPSGTGLLEKNTDMGLSQDYKDSSNEISKWLKHSFLLHFLCPSAVEDSFCEDVMSSTPEDHRCSKYADYLFENFMYVKFPTEMWADITNNKRKFTHLYEFSLPGHYLENSLICMILNPLFSLYGLPLISYSVMV